MGLATELNISPSGAPVLLYFGPPVPSLGPLAVKSCQFLPMCPLVV